MARDRLQDISRIYHAACALPPQQRKAFLADACANDDTLRSEVESLLAEVSREEFLGEPAIAIAAQLVSSKDANLTGRRIGTYEIQSLIGAGGMGEVYRAHDSRLGRDVALKILPQAFTASPDRLARFEREARTLAAVNHPHVAAIYGIEESEGVRALVLELVEGQTLADRLLRSRSGLPIADALTAATQIADALECAHEKGIVHRDLKPSNIAFTPSGAVKVLDFGLAKLAAGPAGDEHESGAANASAAVTAAGIILGTLSYMSPEQARAQAVDKRTDVWSFGCVLYEMLTGSPPFDAVTASDTLAAVLQREPNWSALPDSTPPSIRRLLRRCLEKDKRRRLHDIADARLEIEESRSGSPAESITVPGRRWLAWVLAAACLLAGITAGVVASRVMSPPSVSDLDRNTVTFDIEAPPETAISGSNFSVSPDGRQIAWCGRGSDGVTRIWIRPLSTRTAREIPGTDGARGAFWSPDNQNIGFFVENSVRRVNVAGGTVQTIANTAFASVGATWGPQGVIVFSSRYGLYAISAAGGDARPVADVDPARQEESLRYPQFLPDGRHFLYVARSGRRQNSSAYVGSIDDPRPRRLFPVLSKVEYASGHLLYVQDGNLMARPFDLKRLTAGEPVLIAGDVGLDATQIGGNFSASNTGILVYRRFKEPEFTLRWFDRSGQPGQVLGATAAYNSFSIAPDGKRVATSFADRTGNRSVWILEEGAATPPLRLTFAGQDEWQPIWSPDGSRIAFGSYRNGPSSLYIKSSIGGGDDQLMLTANENAFPQSWSRNGFLCYFLNRSTTRRDLLVMPVANVSDSRESMTILESEADEHTARFSPDGRWLAYVSNETGRSEVYVRPFPATSAGRWQVSAAGAEEPVWSADGRELYYLGLDGTLTAVAVTVDGATFRWSSPKPLFRTAGPAGAPDTRYDAAPDGRRFLIKMPAGPASPSEPLTVLVNWLTQLRAFGFNSR